MHEFYNPVRVTYISVDEYLDFLEQKSSGKTVGLFLNQSLVRKLSLDHLVNKLIDVSKHLIWINEINANPTVKDIISALCKINQTKLDIIIAIGGGSVIDIAKSVKALMRSQMTQYVTDDEIVNLILNKKYLNNNSDTPLIATPTTTGTGSEMTKWCTIWDPLNNKKFSIEAKWLYPDTACLVPELTCSLPIPLTISTSLDAFTQACEAFWAKSSSPYVKELALTAICLIKTHLPLTISNPNNFRNRSKLLIASSISGLAFSQTRTTACHSISYPLTNRYKIPHGIAVTLSLSRVLQYNLKAVPEISEIIDLFSGVDALNAWLYKVTYPHFGLSLSSYGVPETEIPSIVEDCYTKGRMDNNPIYIKQEDLMEILNTIY